MKCPRIFGAPLSIALLAFITEMIRATTLSSLLGYMPTLLQRFGLAEVEIGYYQGLMIGQYFTVHLLTLTVLGCIGDIYSSFDSKRLFLISNAIQGFALLLLAFSKSTPYVFCAVFVLALPATLRPNLDCIVFKCTNTEDRVSVVTYLISMPYTLGFFFGPAISGSLSFPLEQYPGIFPENVVTKTYLVFIPNMLLFLLQIATIGWAVLVLKTGRNDDEKENENLGRLEERRQPLTMFSVLKSMSCERDYIIIHVVLIANAFVWQGSNNSISLYFQTSYEKGGLGFSPSKEAQIYFAAGFVVLFGDLFIIANVISALGLKNGLHFWTMFMTFFSSIVVTFRGITEYTEVFYTINVAMIAIGVTGTRVSIYNIIVAIVPSETLGQCMAIRMIFATVGDIISFFSTGSLFAWSLRNELNFSEDSIGFPFNHAFVFYVISFLTLLCVFCETQLFMTTNKQ